MIYVDVQHILVTISSGRTELHVYLYIYRKSKIAVSVYLISIERATLSAHTSTYFQIYLIVSKDQNFETMIIYVFILSVVVYVAPKATVSSFQYNIYSTGPY